MSQQITEILTGLPFLPLLSPPPKRQKKTTFNTSELQRIQTKIHTDLCGKSFFLLFTKLLVQLCAEKQHSFWHFACQGFPKPRSFERERQRNNFLTQTRPCFETLFKPFLSAVLTGHARYIAVSLYVTFVHFSLPPQICLFI